MKQRQISTLKQRQIILTKSNVFSTLQLYLPAGIGPSQISSFFSLQLIHILLPFCRLWKLSIVADVDEDEVDDGKCYLDHICVDEKFRGKGIGKVLMETADNEARKHGCKVQCNIHLS